MKILLADDHGLFRDSMAVWLKQLDVNENDTLEIEFSQSFDDVTQHLQKQKYDLVLLDLNMPDMEGVISVKYFCNLVSTTPIVVVSADENPNTISACIDAGAFGYVTKSSNGKTILKAIKQILSGIRYFPSHVTEQPLHKFLPKLNDKQQQILSLIVKGHSNKLISETLNLTEGTVKQYVSQLLNILNVDNRTQAAKKAQEIFCMNNA